MVVGIEVVGGAGIAHELGAGERPADQRRRRVAGLDRIEGGSLGHHSSDPLAGLDQGTARHLHLLAALVVEDGLDHRDLQLAGAAALLLGDAHDAVLRGQHVAGKDRREILELLLAVHDVAPVRDLERLRRRARLVEKRAQQGRRREDAAERRLAA